MKCQKLQSVSVCAHIIPEFISGKSPVICMEERKIKKLNVSKILGIFGLIKYVFRTVSNLEELTCPQRYCFLLEG